LVDLRRVSLLLVVCRWQMTAEYLAPASLTSTYILLVLTIVRALVYFMQTGFAMLCAGSIRAKNVKNVILWNLLDSAGGGLAFWAVGWGFAYGGPTESQNFTFIGNTRTSHIFWFLATLFTIFVACI